MRSSLVKPSKPSPSIRIALIAVLTLLLLAGPAALSSTAVKARRCSPKLLLSRRVAFQATRIQFH